MRLRLQNLRLLDSRQVLAVTVVVLLLCAALFGSLKDPRAHAATAGTINFQARLMNDGGTIAPDGDYNVEFKLYTAATPDGGETPDQGACTVNVGTPDEDCVWVETRVSGDQVRVVNGYLTVNLGSVDAFGSVINWDQDLWLTMNIGGTGSPTWDGEMSPRLKLTAVPYAFRAGQLAKLTGANTSTLSFDTQTAARDILLPDEDGVLCIQASTDCGFITGLGDAFIQGGNSFGAPAVLGTNDNNSLSFEVNNDTVATFAANGSLLLQASALSTSAFNVKDDDGDNVFTVNTTNARIGMFLGGSTLPALTGDGLELRGALRLSGTSNDTYTTPKTTTPSNINARISVVNHDLSAGSQMLALGVTSGSDSTARAITAFDARTGAHQPTLGVMSPDDSQMAGFSWDGSNTGFLIKNPASGSIGLNVAGTTRLSATTTGVDINGVLSSSTATLSGANALTLGTTGTNTGAILFRGSTAASGTITLVGAANPSTGNYTLTIPTLTANANICTDNAICAGYAPAPVSGYFLQQAPTSNTAGVDGANVVSPTTNSVVGLTVNGTTGTAATAAIINQAQGADALNVNVTGSSQTNGILIDRTNAGTLSNALNITNTSGTVTNGLAFTGTIGTDIVRGSGTLTMQGGGGVTISTSNVAGASGTILIQGGNSSGGTAGSVTLDTGTTSTGTPAVNIGNTNAKGVQIGNNTSNPTITLDSGTGAIAIGTGAQSRTITIGNNTSGSAVTQTITIGTSSHAGSTNAVTVGNSTATASTVTINGGTNSGTSTSGAIILQAGSGGAINVGNTAASKTINIGSTAALAGDSIINIGNSTANIQTIQMGSTNSTSATTIQAGSGNINLLTAQAGSGTIVKSVTNNSASAFQIQNSASTSLVNVNTLTTDNNLWFNPSFETGIGGVAIHNSGTTLAPGPSGVSALYGKGYLSAVIPSTSGSGVEFRFPFQPNTTYSLSMWIRRSTGGPVTNFNMGRNENPPSAGSTTNDSNCTTTPSTITVDTTWRQYTCSFTTGSGTIIGPTSNFYLKVNTASGSTVYIDGVTLVASATPLNYANPGSGLQVEPYYGNFVINGLNNSEIQPWQQALPIANTAGTVQPRSRPAVAAANGYVYVMGGGTGADGATPQTGTYYARVNVDGSLGPWTTTTSLGTAVSGAGATVVNGFVYVIGGSTGSDSNLVQYAKLNADGTIGTWSTTTSLGATNRDGPAVVNYNGYIYVVGGNNGSTTLTTTLFGKVNSDGTISSWTDSGNVLSIGREQHQVSIVNGWLHITGGCTSNCASATNRSEYARINSNGTLTAWQQGTDLPTAIADQAVVALNGTIYVMTGWDGTGSNMTRQVYYNTILSDGSSNGPWVTSANPVPIAHSTAARAGRENAKAVAMNGYIYLIGGDDVTAVYSTIFYTSTARTKLAGALDLVGASGNNLADTGAAGGQLTAGDTMIVGTLQVQEAAQFARNLSVGGSATFHNMTNSVAAFSVLNAAASNSVLTVDTTNSRVGINITQGAVPSADLSFGVGDRTINVLTQTATNTAGSNLTVIAATGNGSGAGGIAKIQGGTGGATGVGGAVTIQGGTAGGGNTNGGNVNLVGGSPTGSGVKGLVVIDTPTFAAASTQTCAGPGACTITQANIDSNGAVLINATASGLTVNLSDPTITTAGRIIYVNNIGATNDFTLAINGGVGSGNTVAMKPNTTATMVWNGVDWTAAGASSSTDLQAAYNNTASSAGAAELVLKNTATSNGLTVRNGTSADEITGGLLEVQTSIGSNLFTVNNNATEYANNGGAESSTFTMWVKASTGALETVGRNTTTTGNIIATGQASTRVDTTAVAAQGAENTLSTTLSNGLKYQVSYSIKAAASSFTSLDTMYSYDGSATNVRHCVSGTPFYSTGTASQSTTTITGVGTTWTNAMVGKVFVFANGSSTVISGFTNATTLTAATSQTVSTVQKYGAYNAGYTVNYGTWSRVTCTFVAPPTGTTITSNNSVMIRQTDTTSRTFYIDNLSVTVGADVNHAVDGSVDDATNFASNWTDFDGGTGSTTLVYNATTIYDTGASAEGQTTANATQGIRNNMSIAPSTDTQYLVTFYARASVAMTDTLSVGFLPAGGTSAPTGDAACSDYSTQSLTTSGWTKITCLFKTALTSVTNPDLVIFQTDATARSIFVDALSVTLNTNTASNVQIGGANKGGPTTLLTLDRSSSAPIAANNDAYLGSMYYDTTSGRIQCYEADGWGACGAAPDNIVNLNPEYAGAVLNGPGIGTMTADFCSDDTALQINVSLCETGQAKNFYKWTSPQSTEQTYSIYVTYQLPATFNGFSSDDTVQLVARTDSTSNAAVTYEMYKSTGSAVTLCGSGETTVVTSANTWQSVGINGNEATGCSFSSSSAGNFIIFKINLKAKSNANAYVSTLSFTTTGR